MSTDDALIGRKLGDYTIQALLGRGGMSRVYRGFDENLERYAAVKVISGDFATTSEEEYTRRFQTEARAIARLRHPNIVGIYQFGRSEGIYYMAQVFLEGDDLRGLLKKYARSGQRMPVAEVLRIVDDVAQALDYAHSQGVIHRDIKPSNIMLEKTTGRAIMMDFGLALSVHEGTMGDTFGSAHYIAPEQAVSSAKAVPQSDLYSLGIVIYEMLTGKVPFDDPSVMSVALKHLNEVPPPPTMYNPDLPSGVEQVIMQVLDKDPTLRYSSGRALHMALETAFEQVGGRAVAAFGPSITDMLERPDTPTDPGLFSFDESTPPPAGPGVQSEAAEHLLRRKSERHSGPITEDDLFTSEQDLARFLDSLPNAIDVEAAAAALAAAQAEAEAAAAQPRRGRRSRIGFLLASILIIVVLATATYLATQTGDGDAGETPGAGVAAVDGDTPVATDGTAGALVAEAEQTATHAALLLLTETGDAPVTETPSLTSSPVSTVTSAPDTDTPRITDTDTVTDSPTPTQTETVPATETPTVEDVATEPSATDPPPTTAVAQADTTSPSPTARPTETLPVVTREPNVKLVYNADEILLINISGDQLDVSALRFTQNTADGRELSFDSTIWNRTSVAVRPDQMVEDGCYQFVTGEAAQSIPGRSICTRFLGWYTTYNSNRYVWVSAVPGATFDVSLVDEVTGTARLLARCEIDEGECSFYVGEDAFDTAAQPAATASATPQPSVTPRPSDTPSRTPSGDTNVRLVYDDDTFALINESQSTLDISNLSFERQRDNGVLLRFEARLWNQPDIEGNPNSMLSHSCYQLVTTNGTNWHKAEESCILFLGYFRTTITSRYFWLPDAGQTGQTFLVEQGGREVTTCEIDAGECAFYLEP